MPKQSPINYYSIADVILHSKDMNVSRETVYRAAINRIYYGFLHHRAQRHNINTGNQNTHYLIKTHISNTLSSYIPLFDNFEEIRIKADYNNERIKKGDVEKAIRFLEKLPSLFGLPEIEEPLFLEDFQ